MPQPTNRRRDRTTAKDPFTHVDELTPKELAEQSIILRDLASIGILESEPTPHGLSYVLARTGRMKGLNAIALLFRMLTPEEQGSLYAFVLTTYRYNIFEPPDDPDES